MIGSPDRIEEKTALALLEKADTTFITLFDRGLLTVEIYKPDGIDKQTPHDRDEFYLVISGQGRFQLEGKLMDFRKGDFLYVPAHAEHRFIDFSDDFVTWVFFVGRVTGR